ncbi:RNA methyltransferase [uncultured Eudoraea sp.]|uniref:TrmH family RNA methyltransferase n=1 Tax=uncultured Eudoraea sp. TaxID=1035614 RepID=UPI002614AD67|nr:RNA methyltransferase [uncultured Eudoraea sp.]
MIDQNLLAYLETFITPDRINRFKAVLAERTDYITVAIEDVFQMHNTSAVLRSCDVFGIQSIHVIEAKFAQDLDKNIAMGAEKWVDIQRYSTAKSCIDHLREQGYKIVATTPHTESCLLEDFDITDKTALFFGTEKEGLSEVVLKEADAKLKIPMSGFSESLNISVSAAIILYDLTQKLKRSDVSWQLTDTEILKKRLDWTKKTIKSIEEIMERYVKGH